MGVGLHGNAKAVKLEFIGISLVKKKKTGVKKAIQGCAPIRRFPPKLSPSEDDRKHILSKIL